MRKRNSIPLYYQENTPGSEVLKRGNDQPKELGKSPVNFTIKAF
jgi:hypothetical protein